MHKIGYRKNSFRVFWRWLYNEYVQYKTFAKKNAL